MEHPEEHDDPEVLESTTSRPLFTRAASPFDLQKFTDFVEQEVARRGSSASRVRCGRPAIRTCATCSSRLATRCA